MTTDHQQPAFTKLLDAETMDAFSNAELGQLARLLGRLLQAPDRSIPADGAALARMLGEEPSPAVLGRFRQDGNRLRCAQVDDVLEEAAERRRLLSEAGRRGNARRWLAKSTNPSGEAAPAGATDRSPCDRQAIGWRSPPDRHPADATESAEFLAHAAASRARAALQRRDSNSNPLRSGARTAGEMPTRSEIAGAIHDGLEAAAEARLSEYRRCQATTLLERAFAGWLAEKRIQPRKPGHPLPDARREALKIAAYPQATPAACEIAIIRCDSEHADPNEGPVANPIAFVIGVLGAHRNGKPFEHRLHEQPIVDKWDAAERRVFDSAKTMAAADAAARRIDDARAALLTNQHHEAAHGATSTPRSAFGDSA